MGWEKRLRGLLICAAFLAFFALGVFPASAAQVKRFTDSQGVIHITNAARPEQDATAPKSQPAPAPTPEAQAVAEAEVIVSGPPNPSFRGPENKRDKLRQLHLTPAEPTPGGPESKAPNQTAVTPGAEERVPPVEKAAQEQQPPPQEPATPPVRKVSLEATPAQAGSLAAPPKSRPPPGAIRSYRDGRGVLHITNVALDEPGAPPPPLLPTATGAAAPAARPPRLKKAEVPEAPGLALPLSLQKVSWSRDDLLPRPPPGLIPSRKAVALLAGAIRRYRDTRGVLHIDNVGLADPKSRPPPLVLAAAVESDNWGRPPFRIWKEVAKDRAGPLGSGSRVVAFRDRGGRLTIRNADEGVSSRGPPPGWDLASLDPAVFEAAQTHRLPIPLVLALVKVESNFVPWAVSPKGAMGLMQLMPETATFLRVRNPFSPRENLQGGCRYLRLLLDCFNGSLPLALAAYNAGYQRVLAAGFQIPPIKETQEFVTRVLGLYYQWVNRAGKPGSFI